MTDQLFEDGTKENKKEFVLTRDNYFSREASELYWSKSQYSEFDECESQAMARLKEEFPKKDSSGFLPGQYVHSWSEGTKDQFIGKHPEIISSKGATKGQVKAEYKKANEAIELAENDPYFMKALEGKKEHIITSNLFGVEWKCMVDVINEEYGRIVDLKYLKEMYGKEWVTVDGIGVYVSKFEAYQYDYQAALYPAIEKAHSGRNNYLEPFFAIMTKETVSDREIISFSSEDESHEQFIDSKLAIVAQKMPRFIKVKAGEIEPAKCGKCDYCKSKKKLTGTTHYSALQVY